MKFIYAPINVDYIARKVRAEEQRTGRVVTTVELSREEWASFIGNSGYGTYYCGGFQDGKPRYRIPALQNLSIIDARESPTETTIRTIDVVPERY